VLSSTSFAFIKWSTERPKSAAPDYKTFSTNPYFVEYHRLLYKPDFDNSPRKGRLHLSANTLRTMHCSSNTLVKSTRRKGCYRVHRTWFQKVSQIINKSY